MAEEGGDISEMGRRRSARILALEEEKKRKMKMKMMKKMEAEEVVEHKAGVLLHSQQQVHDQKHQHGLVSCTTAPSTTVKQYGRRRACKRKRLQDVTATSFAYPSHQIGENRKYGGIAIRNDPRATSSFLQQMPERRALELVLDILQRRDTHAIFAQPVNPQEVEGYHKIIKQPMDFGTMRAKLQHGMYTSLAQFERDVFLVCSNAMHFNAPTTIFYREARGMHELAQKVFHTLKTNPQNFGLEVSQARRRPGSRDGFETEKCQTYRPCTPFASGNEALVSSVYSASKPIVHITNADLDYKKSLMRFAKELGPMAQTVANRKLEQYLQIEASHNQSQSTPILPPAMTPNYQVPGPSLMQPPASLGGVNKGKMPETQSVLHDFPWDLNVNACANMPLNIHSDPSKEQSTHSSSHRINIKDGANKGKMVCRDMSRMDLNRTYLRGVVPPSHRMRIGSNPPIENAHFNSTKGVKIGSSAEIAANRRKDGDFLVPNSKGKGKMVSTNDNNMDHLPGKTAHQNQNQQLGLGSHFPFAGKENMSSNAGNYGVTNMCSNYTNVKMMMMPVSTQVGNQVQPSQLGELQSKLMDLISKSPYSDTSFLHPQAAKLLSQPITSLPCLGTQNEGGVYPAAQPSHLVGWSQHSNQSEFPNMQMQVNKGKDPDSGAILHQPSKLVAAQKMALLHAMSFYEKETPEDRQAVEASDAKKLDLALQL
uniref:Bromo domain-containing protein n=2 Tax=Quercus lobata TaxID=97700 RepID=A0A7N2KNK2_QUELO